MSETKYIKIYTKKGDLGKTSLWNGERTGKNSIIIKALGELDKLSVTIGDYCVVLGFSDKNLGRKNFLREIQRLIQDINTHVATPDTNKVLPVLNQEIIERMEKDIDNVTMNLPPLTNFIIPCQYENDTKAHYCRVQTRIAESYLVDVSEYFESRGISLNPFCLKFLNRLSDYFFTIARYESYLSELISTK